MMSVLLQLLQLLMQFLPEDLRDADETGETDAEE